MYKVYPLPVQDVQFGVHHMLTYGPSASPGRIYGPLNMSELISMRAGGMASGRAGVRARVAEYAPEELILQAACARDDYTRTLVT